MDKFGQGRETAGRLSFYKQVFLFTIHPIPHIGNAERGARRAGQAETEAALHFQAAARRPD